MWFLLTIAAVAFRSVSSCTESLIVKRYHKDPRVILCVQNTFMLAILLALIPFMPLKTAWAPVLFFAGMSIYAGDYLYCRIIDHVDISTLNGAWALFALLLSIVGFLFFGESWSPPQTAGALLILMGALSLAYWHRWRSFTHTASQYAMLILICAPVFIVRKIALNGGAPVFATFFWTMLSYALVSLVVGLLSKSSRSQSISTLKKINTGFFPAAFMAVTSNLLAAYLLVRAYAVGPISLISVVSNLDAFVILVIAWLLSRFAPGLAPRELLTRQSLQTKILSFLLVGLGMSLLALA